jgi:hypothetical protein
MGFSFRAAGSAEEGRNQSPSKSTGRPAVQQTKEKTVGVTPSPFPFQKAPDSSAIHQHPPRTRFNGDMVEPSRQEKITFGEMGGTEYKFNLMGSADCERTYIGCKLIRDQPPR